MRCRALSLALPVWLAGCATTTLRSGEPPGKTAAGFEERWHPAFLFGTVRGFGFPYGSVAMWYERFDVPGIETIRGMIDGIGAVAS